MALSKPLPGTLIDPTNPWARGLVNAVLGNQSGQRVINHAPNFNGIDGAGKALQLVGSPGGGAIKTNGSTAFANFGNQPRMRGTGPVTVAFRFKVNSITPANLPMVYSVGYDGVDVSLYIGFNANSAGNGKLWWICGGATPPFRGGLTNTDFSSSLGVYFDVLCEYNGAAYNIDVNGVSNYTNNNSGARVNNGTKVTIGSIDLNGTNSRFGDFNLEYLFHWEGRTFSAAEKKALRANPWQLWPDDLSEAYELYVPVGNYQAADGRSVGSSIGSSFLASYFAAQAISNAMASASAVQSSTAGIQASTASQAFAEGKAASTAGVDGFTLTASSSDIQTATITVIASDGAAISEALSSIVTQDVLVSGVDASTNGLALLQAAISATAGVDGASEGVSLSVVEQAAIAQVDGASQTVAVTVAEAAIVLSSDGSGEACSIVVGQGLGLFGADGAAGSAQGHSAFSVDVQSIGSVPGSAIGHSVAGAVSGATAIVSGRSRGHSVVAAARARVMGRNARDVSIAIVTAKNASVLAKSATSESSSEFSAASAGVGASEGISESQSVSRGYAETTITANYPVSIDLTNVPPDSWMVLVPLETTTAAVSVYGDDATVPQEVTTVTVQADDAVPVPVDTWKATA